jgi:hypothetical protein
VLAEIRQLSEMPVIRPVARGIERFEHLDKCIGLDATIERQLVA